MALERHNAGSNKITAYLKSITPTQLCEDVLKVYKKEKDNCAFLDTLKVANITQDGPTKTVTGGQYADALIKFGKTATCELTEALGNSKALEILGGAELDGDGNIYLTGKYSGTACICGENYFIDQTSGDQKWVHEILPQFLPDSVLEFTQDAEGDATTFSLNGSLVTTQMLKAASGTETLDVQAGFIDNAGDGSAFKRFGIVTVMTNVIVVPWTIFENYITEDGALDSSKFSA